MLNPEKINKDMLRELPTVVKSCEAIRRNSKNPREISLSNYVKEKYAMDMPAYLTALGIEPHIDTVENLYSVRDIDTDYRWILPEVIRQALSLGLRKAPIWNDLIAGEIPVSQTSITMPHWNMSDATPEYVGEAETIPLGSVSFGQKKLEIRKMGKGIKIPDEVRNYVPISILQIFLQDFGVKLNQGIDNLLITVLINGEQNDGSESAPIIGVTNVATGITYPDMLRLWIRMSRLGRSANKIIGGEIAANSILNLDEFKKRYQGTPDSNLNLKTPVPQSSDFYIHGSIPSDQILVVDRSSSVLKFNARPLLVETERIVSNQTEGTYATLTTGFGVIYRDARALLDGDVNFATDGFPAWMDVDAAEGVEILD